jgi:hypothetical protein
MKNFLLPLLSALLLVFIGLSQQTTTAQPWTEGFESGLTTSYTTGTRTLGTGDWTMRGVIQESYGNTGSRSARINDDEAGNHLTTPALNTVGTVSFWYRELNSGGGTFDLQTSTDGTNFTTVVSQAYSGATWTQFTYAINSGAPVVYVRVLSDDNLGHLNIDDFSVTSYSAPSADTEINFTSATSTVTEDGTSVQVCAGIANESATASTVTLNLTGGTATNGTDFFSNAGLTNAFPASQTLTFPSNSSADQCVTVYIDDDAADEGDETVTFSLTGASGGMNASVGSADTHTLTIEDNDGPCLEEDFSSGNVLPSGWNRSSTSITFGSGYADMAVTTGDLTTASVSNPITLTFDLSRTSNSTAKNLDIEVSTTNQSSGFSVVTNYDHSNTTSGGTTACTVDLSAYNANSTVYIRFNKTSGSTSPWRIDNVEVTCGAAPPSINLSISPTSGSEDTPGTDITLTATATAAVDGDQTITVDLSGSAAAADFQSAPPTTITILDGQTSGISSVFRVLDDAVTEGSETATFTITNITSGGTAANIGATNAVNFDISDNDIAANDDCAAAVNLTVNAAATNGNMLGVTATNGTLSRNDVWYTFTPTCTGTHAITATFASGPDLDIEVYPASSCPTNTTGRLANGNSSNATSETLSFPGAVGSTTYLIRVIDFDGDADAFTIQVTTSAAPSFTLANTGTPGAGNIDVNTANEVLYGFALTPAVCPGTYDFTACNIQTAGTTTTADLSNFRLLVDANNNGVADAGEISSPIGAVATLADPLAFTGLGQTGLTATVRYLLIADVAAGATAGRTFTASMAAADVTAAETVTGTASGNTQTIFAPAPPCSELFISEYHEGASGNEKYIEIYNPTSSAITLTGTYSLVSYVNGSVSVSNTLDLTGSLGAYTAGYIRNSSAALSAGALASNGSVMTFNGNDAIALRKNGTNIDVIGTIGSSADYGVDVVLRRNASVEAPTTSYDPLEWSSSAANDVSDIGSHLSDCFVPNPEATISINTPTGSEDAETAITLTISTDVAVTGDQTVQVTLGGTGVTNGDFTGVTFPVTVTILNGQDEANVSFTVNDDSDVEGDETATFTIVSPSSGINIGTPSSVSLDIDDNDNLTSTESAVIFPRR